MGGHRGSGVGDGLLACKGVWSPRGREEGRGRHFQWREMLMLKVPLSYAGGMCILNTNI